MAVTSLVLGIISVVVAVFFAGLNWLAVILGVLGIVFGAMAKKQPERKGLATAGLVLSIVGCILGVVMYLACVACVGGLASLS